MRRMLGVLASLAHHDADDPHMEGDADPVARWIADHRGRLVLLAAALVALVAAQHILLEHFGALPGDRAALALYGSQQISSFSHDLPWLFGTMALPTPAGITILVAVWLVRRRLGWRSAILVAATTGVVIANDALKTAWGPTPIMVEYLGADESGNFPSGHVAYATAVFGFFAWLALRRGQRDIAAAFLGVVVLMGPSRILTHAHFPSDVIAGYTLGAAWLVLVIALGEPWRSALRRPTSGAAITQAERP